MVDQQHRALFDLINKFGASLLSEQAEQPDAVRPVLAELSRYAWFHFTEEEAMMVAAGVDPRHLAEHRKGHRDFMVEVKQMTSSVLDGHGGAEALLKFLTHWLAYHILGTDQALARQLVALRNGKSPAAAYRDVTAPQPGPTQPLLESLNGLFRLVSERNRELVLINRTLERKVGERTRDLTEANERLEELALTDALTGLPNRRHAMVWMQAAWTQARTEASPFSCMMIDADGFKQANDLYGHDAGDELLRQLSRVLRHSVRTDDFVARLGGDEFLIGCPRTPIDGVLQVAQAVLGNVAALRVPVGKGGTWAGSVSIGVAERAPGMSLFDDMIKAADAAVYKAKHHGRNRVES